MVSGFPKHIKNDLILGQLCEQIDLLHLVEVDSLFNELVESILSQQLNIKVAAIMIARLHHLADEEPFTPIRLLELKVEDMRAVGLSNSKANYIHNIAIFWQENNLEAMNWHEMKDDEIIELLTRIKGVGLWTVQMLLIFALNRPDIWPTGDLGVQLAVRDQFRLGVKGKELILKMNEIADPWRPHRSIAARLLWKSRNLTKV